MARAPKRELISRTYNLILRTVLATRVRDAQCGFKAVRADVARRLLPAVEDDGWFFDTELLLLAERNGLRIHEVPVDWIDDADSRVHVARTALDDLAGTARMARTFAAGRGRLDLGTSAAPARSTTTSAAGWCSFGLIGAAEHGRLAACCSCWRCGTLGAIGANALAVSATFVANTWANARFTMRTSRAALAQRVPHLPRLARVDERRAPRSSTRAGGWPRARRSVRSSSRGPLRPSGGSPWCVARHTKGPRHEPVFNSPGAG